VEFFYLFCSTCSFDEIGRYDVPPIIDYVLKKTKAKKVNWIGHSMGCAIFFICMHYNPEYNSKVNKMIALAPAAYVGATVSPVGTTMALTENAVYEVEKYIVTLKKLVKWTLSCPCVTAGHG